MEETLINGYKLEICSSSLYSAKQAAAGGASRVELCQNLENGGITPSYGQIKLTRQQLAIGIHVLIRPRGGDFLYSEDEFQQMREDVRFCRDIGCDGIVIGLLEPNGHVDKERTSILVNDAGPLTTVFHRAFDRCLDPMQALDDIIEIGCQRLLTSGQEATAWEGRVLIQELVQRSKGRIEVMPGSGVDESNIKILLKETGARSIHSSAKERIPSAMDYQSSSFLGMDEDCLYTSKEKVAALVNQIKSL